MHRQGRGHRDQDSVPVSQGLSAATRSHNKARKTPSGSPESIMAHVHLDIGLLVLRRGMKQKFYFDGPVSLGHFVIAALKD